MTYILEDLLRVRIYRENSAKNIVKQKQHLYDAASRKMLDKEQQLRNYTAFRIAEEDRLYEEVRNQKVSVKELDDLKLMVGLLRNKQVQLEQDLDKAVKGKEEANQQLELAKNKRVLATREKEKIEEHKKIWLESSLRQRERIEEKEAEDFQISMNPAFDSGEEDYEDW